MAECLEILKERCLLKIDPLEMDFSTKGFVDGVLINYPMVGKTDIGKHYFLCDCEFCEIYRQHTQNEGYRLQSLKLLFGREKQKRVIINKVSMRKNLQFYYIERNFKGETNDPIEKYLLNRQFLPKGSIESIISDAFKSLNFKGDFDNVCINLNFDHVDEFFLECEERNVDYTSLIKRLDNFEAKVTFNTNLGLLNYELRNWDRIFEERRGRSSPPHEVYCDCDHCKNQKLKRSLRVNCGCEKCVYKLTDERVVKFNNRLWEPVVDTYAKLWEYSEEDIFKQNLKNLELDRIERLEKKRANRKKNQRKNRRKKKGENEC